jgi:hypothetical protein
MSTDPSIRVSLATALLFVAGCASRAPLESTPLGQDDLDQFLAGGRDARNYGITTYQDPAGTRFEFANRVHQDRSAQMDFISPQNLRIPVIRARTASFVDFNLLLDSSARQNWLLLPSVRAMDYVPFKPPTGEYADHVVAEIPGYAGVANKIVLDALHIESPVFYVPPARGGLGPLARANERPLLDELGEKALKSRRALGMKTQAVMGASLMRSFAYIRFDFPGRNVRFSSHMTYTPAASSSVLANLPMRDWHGRPAVPATFDGNSILLVIDTGGDFELSLPGEARDNTGPLVLGDLQIDDVRACSHAELGLPESFPARLGRRLLARYIVTLDHKNQRVWFEGKPRPGAKESATSTEDETPAPVQYRGIKR